MPTNYIGVAPSSHNNSYIVPTLADPVTSNSVRTPIQNLANEVQLLFEQMGSPDLPGVKRILQFNSIDAAKSYTHFQNYDICVIEDKGLYSYSFITYPISGTPPIVAIEPYCFNTTGSSGSLHKLSDSDVNDYPMTHGGGIRFIRTFTTPALAKAAKFVLHEICFIRGYGMYYVTDSSMGYSLQEPFAYAITDTTPQLYLEDVNAARYFYTLHTNTTGLVARTDASTEKLAGGLLNYRILKMYPETTSDFSELVIPDYDSGGRKISLATVPNIFTGETIHFSGSLLLSNLVGTPIFRLYAQISCNDISIYKQPIGYFHPTTTVSDLSFSFNNSKKVSDTGTYTVELILLVYTYPSITIKISTIYNIHTTVEY